MLNSKKTSAESESHLKQVYSEGMKHQDSRSIVDDISSVSIRREDEKESGGF